ncbi:rhodanese-like domain-containing protein [Paenibacillus sp. FSL M7-1455]|uniref:Rhodanese-like domain-containing protein n=1 Tax=Paenibacillus cookii TaxID=157839 RepID=A0ABQ4LRI6_9BACL|nr:rhodanese-like domain-containing protein [Paenibacillus cookii]KHF35688.1 putative adenylyltransferase/sulfurtransferase MoeZ [Paenibacillus sp. P1XP2]GIO65884.1 rhodanese-like domain-containing protein [Paenibacillus cookii]
MSNQTWMEIMPEKVEELIRSGRGDVQLIDVRELDEYKEGHIPGVKLIPLSQLEVRHDEIERGKDAILICRSGGRSRQACEFLASRGHRKLQNMSGGMLSWKGEVVRD